MGETCVFFLGHLNFNLRHWKIHMYIPRSTPTLHFWQRKTHMYVSLLSLNFNSWQRNNTYVCFSVISQLQLMAERNIYIYIYIYICIFLYHLSTLTYGRRYMCIVSPSSLNLNFDRNTYVYVSVTPTLIYGRWKWQCLFLCHLSTWTNGKEEYTCSFLSHLSTLTCDRENA